MGIFIPISEKRPSKKVIRFDVFLNSSTSGLSPDIIIDRVLGSASGKGWDFRNDRLTDMIQSGIIDPVKVTKTALQNASSCAGTLITTNYGIIQTETE